MKAIGIVTRVTENIATVVSKRSSACASCHNCQAKGMCHAELVFGNQTENVEVSAINRIGAKVGDTVELESSTSKVLLLSFFTFIFPFLSSALLYLIMNKIINDSNVLPLLMIAVFVICFIVSVFVLNRFLKNKTTAVIVKIIEECRN